MHLGTRKKTLFLLLVANALLLSTSWILAFIAFPRLPQEMPLWLNFFGQQTMMMKKSPLFFIYPLAQSLLWMGFWFGSRIRHFTYELPKGTPASRSPDIISLLSDLRKEFVYLILIFFNLIFIHLQRSLIFMAHGLGEGVSGVYFYTLFGIILVLIPYYRLRTRMLIRK